MYLISLNLENLFTVLFLVNLIILYSIFYYCSIKNMLKKSIMLYFFYFLIIFLFHFFETISMFGFFVFVETTVIFMYILIVVSFFNVFVSKIKSTSFFFILLFLLNSQEDLDFSDLYFNYLDNNNVFYNDFLGLYVFMYCFNYILFFVIIIFFYILFNIVYVTVCFLKNKGFFIKKINVSKINTFNNPVHYFK